MGRPRLYKTQEERSEAARKYRRKYYQRYVDVHLVLNCGNRYPRNKEQISAAKQSLRKKRNTDEYAQILQRMYSDLIDLYFTKEFISNMLSLRPFSWPMLQLCMDLFQ
jgi:hypothetical protein